MSKHEAGFSLVEGLLVLIIIGVVGSIGYYVLHSQKKDGPNTLLTFIGKSDLKAMWAGKTVQTLSLKNGDDTFNVLANNGQTALVAEYPQKGWDDTGGRTYYLITKDAIRQLSKTVVTALDEQADVTETNPSPALLDYHDDYLFVSCDNTANTTAPDTSCTLKSLNLASGDSRDIYSAPIDVADANGSWLEGETTVYLLGTAPNGNVYAVVQSHDLDLRQSVIKIIDQNGSTVKSVPAPQVNHAVLSPDLKNVAYEASSTPTSNGVELLSNSNALNITNLQTSYTVTIASPQTHGFYDIAWSPDSNKVAYETQDNTTPNYSIGYSSLASPKIRQLIDIPPSSDNRSPSVLGWSTNDDINYVVPRSNKLSSASINITSKKVTAAPVPAGYQLVTPFSDNKDVSVDSLGF